MSKIRTLVVLGAALGTLAAGPALAQTYGSGWNGQQSYDANRPADRIGMPMQGPGAVTEGRNATYGYGGSATQGVEPYIAQQIEQNARSNR